MRTAWFIAREGVTVPMEGAARRYIGSAPVELRVTHYYARQLADGDLIEVPAPVEAEPLPPSKES